MIKKLVCVLTIGFVFTPGVASAALVGFLGVLNGGNPGGLGSLPRNFVLTLDYADSVGTAGSVAASFEFPATPNASNPDINYGLAPTGTGSLTVINNIDDGFGGFEDRISFDGMLDTFNGISDSSMNFSFTFVRAADTVDSNLVNNENVTKLIAGAPTTISITNFEANPSGSIQAAPEPSSMLALTGLILGGCGIGYRRRKRNSEAKSDEAE